MAQENQYYSNKIEEKSHDFLRHLSYSIRDYEGRLPNLRDIFRPEAVEWLLAQSAIESDYNFEDFDHESNTIIDFVINTGYKDEPNVDQDGKLLLRRTTPIHHASRINENCIIRDLFKIYDRCDVNYTDENGLTHFHVACKYGCDEIVEKFLDLGQVDPNLLVPETGDSPLHFALKKNRNETVVESLLRRGAAPNLANKDGKTPIHIICEYTYDEVTANVLLGCSDDKQKILDAGDKLGNTPLHMAMYDMDECFMEFLLRQGANPNATNDEGSTPLHTVCKRRLEFVDILEIFFKIAKEVDRMVEVDAKDKLGRTPLQWAVAYFLPDVVDALFDGGADLSNFVFPTESYIVDGFEWSGVDFHDIVFKLSAAPQAMEVVERLQRRGYELRRNDALAIMKFFDKWRLFESADIDEFWYENEEFAAKAKKILMLSGRSLYYAIRLGPKQAARILTYSDYMDLWNLKAMYQLPQGLRDICAKHLSEKVSREFFRRWALDPLLKLTNYRLPILCCDKIMDQLINEDLFNVCLAATDQSL
ncbi:serine/threonine-protein phosphatase 6 regulatory ankyrin repeat subunit A-like [Trichogramma pretiosum]|uniref:serine/threonine-protein phosphatase 6 regulatory ankyrin repeat subunit A-like n=1 Tax=Trichogramma pretiosum TaxID=7493 RepID=UPI0006C946CA|nr:serine/threonine-protein phosphatase 6 regulatory ankyrin repeat subunit A-like [Trichogramma pretiosum]